MSKSIGLRLERTTMPTERTKVSKHYHGNRTSCVSKMVNIFRYGIKGELPRSLQSIKSTSDSLQGIEGLRKIFRVVLQRSNRAFVKGFLLSRRKERHDLWIS